VHLLARLSREVIVPEAVMAEVSAGPMALTPEKLGHHHIVHVTGLHPGASAWDLGAGEKQDPFVG
jgi:hypothetical protein